MRSFSCGFDFLFFCSFVEDRLATLKNVIKTPELDKWNIYLGRWWGNDMYVCMHVYLLMYENVRVAIEVIVVGESYAFVLCKKGWF